MCLVLSFYICVFFFFKQKTAYEMRISDWSSDVCSSDLADQVAQTLGAQIVSRDSISMRQLPAPLQQTLATLQVGQTTQPFGAENEGISVLVLCGRDMPQAAGTPSAEQIEQQLLDDTVNNRAPRYLRGLRRDAVNENRR